MVFGSGCFGFRKFQTAIGTLPSTSPISNGSGSCCTLLNAPLDPRIRLPASAEWKNTRKKPDECASLDIVILNNTQGNFI